MIVFAGKFIVDSWSRLWSALLKVARGMDMLKDVGSKKLQALNLKKQIRVT